MPSKRNGAHLRSAGAHQAPRRRRRGDRARGRSALAAVAPRQRQRATARARHRPAPPPRRHRRSPPSSASPSWPTAAGPRRPPRAPRSTIEPAGTTIDRLAKAEAPGPGHVGHPVAAPRARRRPSRAAPAWRRSSTPAEHGRWPARSSRGQGGRHSPTCSRHTAAGEVTWACLGEVAGKPWTSIGGQASWGDIKPAHEAPDTSASGLLTFANATVGFFGRNDIGTIDLQSDAYSDWVRRLERSIPYFGGPEGTPFERFLLLPEINVVGTTEAEVNAKAGARKAELTVAYPAPMAQADAVMVSSAGAPPNGAAARPREGVAGERVERARRAAPQGGLPAPGVLQALRLSSGRTWCDEAHAASAATLLLAAALAGCTSATTGRRAPRRRHPRPPTWRTADPGDCVTVDVTVSPEKIVLLTDLARTFNQQRNTVAGRCVFVRPQKKSSGAAASLLADGWGDTAANGPQPVIWSPAASGWGSIVNQRLADKGQPAIAPASKAFMLTPLVIAMPKPMAEALGYPAKPIGFKDIAELAKDPQGWAKYGHPEWGPFRLGKTNPNFSTSGLNFTLAEYYAATGKTKGLTSEDLDRPDVRAVRQGRGERRRALRRHDADVPQQLVPRRRSGHGPHVHVGRRRRGEVGARLQQRQPGRRAGRRRGAEAAEGAARRHLPERGHALLRQPPHHPGRALGVGRAEAGRRALPRLRAAAGQPAARAAVRVPARQPAGRRGRADRGGQRRRPERAAVGARGAFAAGAREGPRQVGRAAQAGDG